MKLSHGTASNAGGFRRCAAHGMIFVVLLAASWAAAVSVAAADLDIPYTLSKPAGSGPFPAVVILHDCSGLGPRSSGSPWRWGTRLLAAGYVTIAPDSFATRGHPDGVCSDGSPPKVDYPRRAADAAAALAYLRTLPFVDRTRIAVMGGSHGGGATLAAVGGSDGLNTSADAGFAAAVALYPTCGATYGNWGVERTAGPGTPITGYHGFFRATAPLLILVGDLDDWTPAEPCRELATRAKAAGSPVDIVVYPGAHHAFDSRSPVVFRADRLNRNSPDGHGATTGGNAEAWADAVTRVKAFLGDHLAAKPQ